MTTCFDVFECFVKAAQAGIFIESENDNDKKFISKTGLPPGCRR